MNLYTECFWDGWDKIVDIYTDKYDSFPDYINDEGTYKIVILEKGIIEGENGTLKGEVKAPAVLLLSLRLFRSTLCIHQNYAGDR